MRFEHYPEQLSLSLIDELEAVDPAAPLTWLAPATTVERFHIVAACDNARTVGFAAADASTGPVTVHTVVLDPAHQGDDALAATLLTGVITACAPDSDEVRVHPDTAGVAGLRDRGWRVVTTDPDGRFRLRGARAA